MSVLPQASAAPEEDTARARALFKRAEVHFSLGEFDEALTLYKEAYKVKPLPGFLFNIGQCYRNLENHDRAVFFFKQYLLRFPDAPNRSAVEELIRLGEEVLQEKAVSSTQPDRSKQVFHPTSAPAPRTAAPSQGLQRRSSREDTTGNRLRPYWFWSVTAVTGALLVSGTISGVWALQKSNEYKDPATSLTQRSELRDTGQQLSRFSSVSFGLAAATSLAAVLIYFYTDFSGKHSAVALTPTPTGGLLYLQASY